jgi:hypothetical protein
MSNEGQQTPTLEQVILDGVDSKLANLNVSMPAIITEYDPATQKCSVQPCIKRKYDDGTIVNLPIISNVPVAFPRAGKAFISLPIKKDHTVLLVVSQRSIDIWLGQGGVVEANDPRKHDLSDAVAIAGVYPFNDNANASANNLRIENDVAQFDLLPNGKFIIKNKSSGQELLTLFEELLDALLAAKTNTIYGPQPLVPPTLFTNIKTKLDTLKGA